MSNEQQKEKVEHQVAKSSYKKWWYLGIPVILYGGFLIVTASMPPQPILPPPPPPEYPLCTSFEYSDWLPCTVSGTQSRAVTKSLPVGCSGGSALWSQTCNYKPTPPQPPSTEPTPVTESSFSQISQADQTRMREIIAGVIQNTIQVTPAIKSELLSIFAKYNTTDAEVRAFATYGPALSVNYQRLFYTDALQAVSTGYPVKSSERLTFEKEVLSRGLMTSERITANDKTMSKIASHQPIVGSDGQQGIFTTDIINDVLNNLDSAGARLNSLLIP